MQGPLSFRSARFQVSAANLSQLPEDAGSEIAFIGRSNAGKSSAINCITDHQGLARTSKTPGRTQLMNSFALDSQHRLVDLPGYGFARVPAEVKKRWQAFIDDYLTHRQSLSGLVLVMDIRHPLKDADQDMLAWALKVDIPVLLLLTKADKLKRGAMMASVHSVHQRVNNPRVEIIAFSAQTRMGEQQVRDKLSEWLLAGPGD